MVLTLTPSLLQEHSHRLASRIQAAGYQPTLLIGILSGGAEVARLLRNDFPDIPYCEVRISRPSTKQKGQGMTHSLLQRLPISICNLLRTFESRVNEWRSRYQQPVRIGQIELPSVITSQLNADATTRILLVDDAIDTGATVQQALQQLQSRFSHVEVRVAVITVTTAHPVCDADYCLYHNRTLCRFPWSNDYRSPE